MGARSVIVISTGASELDTVSLYGHWAGEDNLTAVRNVLARTRRIGDISYLTAQIFHEFTKLGGYEGVDGFGIWAGTADEEDYPTVYLDSDTGVYQYNGETFEEFKR